MNVTSGKRLTTDGAKKMMATAIDKAKQAGIAVSIAITDAGGHLILLERMEGGRFHTVHSATTKAACAASNKRPTSSRGAQAHWYGEMVQAGVKPDDITRSALEKFGIHNL